MNDPITSSNKHRFGIVFLLTILRGPLSVLFAVIFLAMSPSWLRVVLGLLLLGAMELTDILDGIVARRLGIVTEFGAILDPFMDSFSRLVVYWTLACVGLTIPIVPLVMAVRDITIAYCRTIWARKQLSLGAKRSGKIKAIVQGVVAMVIVGEPVYEPLLGSWLRPLGAWVVILVTLASMVEYVMVTVQVTLYPKKSGHKENQSNEAK